jgi:23S rRNA pseudouridine2604 synthase
MCGALNYKVLDLCRVRIMNLSIEGIKEGMWRKLTNDELTELHRLVCAKEDHE